MLLMLNNDKVDLEGHQCSNLVDLDSLEVLDSHHRNNKQQDLGLVAGDLGSLRIHGDTQLWVLCKEECTNRECNSREGSGCNHRQWDNLEGSACSRHRGNRPEDLACSHRQCSSLAGLECNHHRWGHLEDSVNHRWDNQEDLDSHQRTNQVVLASSQDFNSNHQDIGDEMICVCRIVHDMYLAFIHL